MKANENWKTHVPKRILKYNVKDKVVVQRNTKEKIILICKIELDEYIKISSCPNIKEI